MKTLRTDVHRVLDVIYRGDARKARVHYSRERPMELLIQVYPPLEPPATWLVARDLLRDGLNAPSGHGYVHVCADPTTGTTTMQLSRDPDRGTLTARTSDLADLLAATVAVVPFGTERHDWDAGLGRLTA